MKLLLTLSFTLSLSAYADDKYLANIYRNAADTFFCGCSFDINNMQIKDKNCIEKTWQQSPFQSKVVWSTIIPESELAHDLQCWHESQNIAECQSLSPLQCCQKVSEEFQTRLNNLHNQIPALRKVEEQKRGMIFAQVYKQSSLFSSCEFKVDTETTRLEPAVNIKGDIARIYFYFESMGYVNLSRRSRPLMEIWDMQDSVSPAECDLHARKAKVSGQNNPYVANRCD